MMHLKQDNKGFTLVEAILLVSVIGIMMTLVFPDIVSTFRFQKEHEEETRIKMIRDGLEKYTEANMRLPDDNDWALELSEFVPLKTDEIECDTWGRPRVYRKQSLNQSIAGEVFSVDYAMVLSYGENGCEGSGSCVSAAPTDSCDALVPVVPNPRFDEVDFNFVAAGAREAIDDYKEIKAEPGDFLIKFTTHPQRIKAFHETNKRLKRVSQALSNFATEAYNNASIAGQVNSVTPGATVRDWNFYPPSGALGDNLAANYHQQQVRDVVVADLGILNGGSNNISARRTYMVNLMRVLGLPDDHCCSAMETFWDGGVKEVPFYYYSNPRPRVGACPAGSRPGRGDIRQPARVRLTSDPCG